MMLKSDTPRRGFLERALAALAGIAVAPSFGHDAAGQSATVNESWLQGLTGAHKQFVDVPATREGRPLVRVMNFLDAYAEAYGMKDGDLNVVFGTHGGALPLVMNDALWAKYELGKRYAENDPRTSAPATRNPFASGAGASVAQLQQRGVRFIVCLRSLRRLSADLASPGNAADQVRAELLSNLLPGVTPVPALIVATNRAQEAGLTYVYSG